MFLKSTKNSLEFHFWAMAALGKGLSGGDRIFIELARRWSKKYPVTIYVWEEGREMCRRQKLASKRIKYCVLPMGFWPKLGFVVNYLARTIKAIVKASRLTINNQQSTIIYSASDFWMDSLPGWILKRRHPEITWIGAFYLSAPNPFIGFYEEGRLRLPSLKGILYWLMQKPIYYLVRKDADLVFVTSDPDTDRFPKHKKEGRTMVVRGGVNLDLVSQYPRPYTLTTKPYSAVFQGRFHPMKGVLELVEVWKKVVEKFPQAKLAMIGDGPLMRNVKLKIKNEKLEKNIDLLGFVLDGPEKDEVFKKSKVVVHPALYDSGGMAAAEGMAWGLPAVSFDLKALKTYYPKGMLKAKIGNLDEFANLVIKLLSDERLYGREAQEARDLIFEKWNWDKRAEEILKIVRNCVKKA